MKIKNYKFPFREYADMYLPMYVKKMCACCLVLFCVLFVITIFAAFLRIELFMVFLICAIAIGGVALWLHLCYRNIMLVMKSKDAFVYRSFLGNIYEFRFNEIEKIETGVGGIKIVCPSKRIYIDATAIMSEKLQNRLDQVRQRIDKDNLPELPTSSKKTDALSKTFYRRR